MLLQLLSGKNLGVSEPSIASFPRAPETQSSLEGVCWRLGFGPEHFIAPSTSASDPQLKSKDINKNGIGGQRDYIGIIV